MDLRCWIECKQMKTFRYYSEFINNKKINGYFHLSFLKVCAKCLPEGQREVRWLELGDSTAANVSPKRLWFVMQINK